MKRYLHALTCTYFLSLSKTATDAIEITWSVIEVHHAGFPYL